MKEKVTFQIVTPHSLPDIASRCNLKIAQSAPAKENCRHDRSDSNGTVSSESSVHSRCSTSSGSTDSLTEGMSTDHRCEDYKSSDEASTISSASGKSSTSISEPKSLRDVDLW